MRLFSFAAATASCAVVSSLFLCGFGTAARAQAQTPTATAPASAPVVKPRTWLVDNKDRLVTVREKDGSPLFAQVITTPNVTVLINMAGNTQKITITLKDGNGKSLYKMPFPLVKRGNFNFAFTANEDPKTHEKTGGTSFTITPAAPGTEETEDTNNSGHAKMVFVLGDDNWIQSGDVKYDNNHIVLARHDTRITMTNYVDGKKTGDQFFEVDTQKNTGRVVSEGKEVGSFKYDSNTAVGVVRDVKGEIAWKAVKRDGKDYTELTLGERKILLEGGNWSFTSKEGDVFIQKTDPAVATTPAAIEGAK